jgi:SecD/SecF fusion protein
MTFAAFNMDKYLPYMVLVTGLASAGLFVAYFASGTDKRKRFTGTLLAMLLVGFSIFCITEGEGVKKGIDLKGGASFLVKVQPAGSGEVTPDMMDQAQEIIEKRLNPLGSKDITVTKQGEDRLYIEVPGLDDEAIRNSEQLIEKVAKLELRLLPEGQLNFTTKDDTAIKPGQVKLPYRDKVDEEQDKSAEEKRAEQRYVWVNNNTEISGKRVDEAWPELAKGAVNYSISVRLDSEGGKQMLALTQANVGKPMAIVLDNEVLSAPTIKSVFADSFQITGSFTEEQARELSSQLMNPLENPLIVEKKSTISPTYGEAAVRQGLMACLGGLALTLIFMVLYYRLSGIIAVIGLAVNLLLLLGAMRVFDQTLTMPGIAGIILTLGMAIDANVLIYERMREEFAQGKTLDQAIPASYEKAFTAIFDSNITTLITSILMIAVASGAIKGFGLALTIGLIASMFSALLITRVCFLWLSRMGLKKLTFMSLIKNRLYDFMGMRRIWLTTSTLLVIASIAIVAIKGQKVLGYELRGGDMIELKGIPGIDRDTVDNALKDWTTTVDGSVYTHDNINVGTVKPVTLEGPSEEYINIRSNPGTSKSIKAELAKNLGNGDATRIAAFENATTEQMGSAVGGQMLRNSIWAIVAGLIGIFIYLTFRFEMPFAIGGIVAIFHDVIIAVGVCALAGKEIGLILVGAFLTIAGYSINDTIVIFDRVRDNLRTMNGSLKDILNASISATLSRTIITSGVTAMAVVAMLIFGGKSMSDFSFTMLIGMISGVYSTIFIASPVVLWWASKRKTDLRQVILDADAVKLEALSGIEREAPEKPGKTKGALDAPAAQG